MVNPNANIDLYSLLSDSEELTHYGRKGMKWYQHIYGPVQAVAQYAKKAKAKHDEKKQSKWETKKEAIIRSGDAKKIDKYKNYLSDDEMKRATNRLDSSGKLNTAIGKKQVEKNKDMSAQEIINNFSNFAKNAKNVVEAVDTLNSTLEKAKKYTPEGRAKAAAKKDVLENLNLGKYVSNPGMLNNKEKSDLVNAIANYNSVVNFYKAQTKRDYDYSQEQYKKAQEFIGPRLSKNPSDISRAPENRADRVNIKNNNNNGLSEENLKKMLDKLNVQYGN